MLVVLTHELLFMNFYAGILLLAVVVDVAIIGLLRSLCCEGAKIRFLLNDFLYSRAANAFFHGK